MVSTPKVRYETGSPVSVEQFIDVLKASTLGERRPIDKPETVAKMLNNANLTVTAWEGDLLVGIARSLSDFSYVTYCSDLAVRTSHQRQGIGKELLRLTLQAAGCRVVLLSAPKAVDYYPHIGFEAHPSAWTVLPGNLR